MEQKGSYYITSYKGRILSALCQNDRLVQASFCVLHQDSLPVGTILIGKVLNKLENIQAFFVELAPGKRGFMPYTEMTQPYPVQGDIIPVQIIKDAVKTKDPVVSMHLSIAGKYGVVHNENQRILFSKKASPKQIERLKLTVGEFLDSYPYGVILRTNAMLLQEAEPLIQELTTLCDKLEHIKCYAQSRTVHSILYRPMPAYIEKLRDTYGLEYQQIVTDIPGVYEELESFYEQGMLSDIKPELFEKKSMSLLNLHKLAEKTDSALTKNVWLKCGGYIVIEPTESLTAIDVNTGKYVVKSDKEETARKVNLEAAEEIARQLRLRNLSGMILVDFINMKDEAHNQELLAYLRKLVATDPLQTSVIDMTPLGLVEITRKKINKSLLEQYYETQTTE